MRSRTRRGCAQRARRAFCFEGLELRQMMAADFIGPLPVDPSSESAASEPINVAASAMVDPNAPRTFDGTNNNLDQPELGSTHTRLMRIAPSEYGDGVSSMGGAGRPNPRSISNALAAQNANAAPNDRALSAFIYVWGQFLDHDIDLTGTGGATGEPAHISIPQGDALFDPNGTGSQIIPFTRSVFDPTTGTSAVNPREQINQISTWIDGSMVYGSDQATADSLRTFTGGALRTSAGNLPPENASGFLAGDSRANENIELTSLHALFIREHNRLAGEMAAANPSWTDERIYQEARALVIGKIQVITFKEFLPALLGQDALEEFQGYNPAVDPRIANEFSTAAYRLHTMVNDEVKFFGNDGRPVRDDLLLREAFHNPGMLKQTGIDGLLKYAASTVAQEVDNRLVDGLRNFLFGAPGQGGMDLASLNIQRGRDHGLADYNAVRRAYGLPGVTSFAQITSNPGLAQTLQQLYGSVENIDLWVGIMAEDHVAGASMGELGRTIIADQFERLRHGDRFWYQNIFSGPALEYLERATLADVIQRNTAVSNLQSNVFIMQAELSGLVFTDSNINGQQDQNEPSLAGVTVELVNNAGVVIGSSTTESNGRYRFGLPETGDYQVRIVLPPRMIAANHSHAAFVSRGDTTLEGMDFGLQGMGPVQTRGQTVSRRPAFAPPAAQAAHAASVDAIFAAVGFAGALPLGLAETSAL